MGWEGLLCEIIPQWAVKKFNASFNGWHLSRLGKYTTWSPAHIQKVKIISSSLPEDRVPSGWCWAVVPGCGAGGQRGALLQRSCAGGHHGGSGGQSQRHWPGCGSKHTHTRIFCELCLLWMLFLLPAQTKSLLRKSHDWIFISISVFKHWAHNWVCTTLGLSKTEMIWFSFSNVILYSALWDLSLKFEHTCLDLINCDIRFTPWLHIDLINKTKPVSLKHLFFSIMHNLII